METKRIIINKYEIEKMIKSGNFGYIYEGKRISTHSTSIWVLQYCFISYLSFTFRIFLWKLYHSSRILRHFSRLGPIIK